MSKSNYLFYLMKMWRPIITDSLPGKKLDFHLFPQNPPWLFNDLKWPKDIGKFSSWKNKSVWHDEENFCVGSINSGKETDLN